VNAALLFRLFVECVREGAQSHAIEHVGHRAVRSELLPRYICLKFVDETPGGVPDEPCQWVWER